MTNKVKLVCSKCAAINQFDQNRPVDSAICGKCKSKLADGSPVDVTDDALARHIKNSDLPVLVDFWAPWCGPCKVFAPTYQSYAAKNAARIRCLKLNTEQQQQAGAKFNIRSIPTLALFKAGKEINRISGALNESQLTQWVNSNI